MKKVSCIIICVLAMTALVSAGTWELAGDMINGRQMHAAAFDPGTMTLYVIAGNVDVEFPEDLLGQYYDSVGVQYYKVTPGSPITIDAGAWGPSLSDFHVDCSGTVANVACYNSDGAFIYNGRLYFTPANSNADTPWSFNKIVMTDIDTSGALLGTWSLAGTPPVTTPGNVIFDCGWAVYGNRLYRVSGREAAEGCTGGTATYIAKVVSGEFQSDGTITNWRDEADLPVATRWGTLQIVDGLAIYAGGTNAGGNISAVYVSDLGTNGEITSWVASANPMPVTCYMSSGCANGSYIYVLTGRQDGTNGILNSYRAKVNVAGTDIDAWEAFAAVPYQNKYAAACGGASFFFITGGRDEKATGAPIVNDVYAMYDDTSVSDWTIY